MTFNVEFLRNHDWRSSQLPSWSSRSYSLLFMFSLSFLFLFLWDESFNFLFTRSENDIHRVKHATNNQNEIEVSWRSKMKSLFNGILTVLSKCYRWLRTTLSSLRSCVMYLVHGSCQIRLLLIASLSLIKSNYCHNDGTRFNSKSMQRHLYFETQVFRSRVSR